MKFCRLFEIGPYQVLIFINDDQITLTCDVGSGPVEIVEDCQSKSWARKVFEEFDEKEANEFVCCQLSCSDKLH